MAGPSTKGIYSPATLGQARTGQRAGLAWAGLGGCCLPRHTGAPLEQGPSECHQLSHEEGTVWSFLLWLPAASLSFSRCCGVGEQISVALKVPESRGRQIPDGFLEGTIPYSAV